LSRAGALAVALVAASVAAPTGRTAEAAVGPPSAAPGQFYGLPWGGGPLWPGPPIYFGPDFTSPYQGSPGYPYYRYGAAYGNTYGTPYYANPGTGAYYGGAASAWYPSYSSAGGIAFGDYSGGYGTVGRCLYGASAGYGGSWSDPLSYGYVAPYC
jgi:hypothetical protein